MKAVSGAVHVASNCNSIGPTRSRSCSSGGLVQCKNAGGSVSLGRGRFRPPPRFIYVLEPAWLKKDIRSLFRRRAPRRCDEIKGTFHEQRFQLLVPKINRFETAKSKNGASCISGRTTKKCPCDPGLIFSPIPASPRSLIEHGKLLSNSRLK